MPRLPNGIYNTPVGTQGIQDTPILSSPYNFYLADIELDLNTARPIVAGGTGASTAAGAMANLGGELASQIVTNYDTFPFKPGSFYSAVGATNAPTAGHAFAGVAYGPDAGTLVIEARDLNDTFQPGHLYVRERDSGIWGPWLNADQRALDAAAACVLKAGDTMTGGLFLNADPAVALHAATKQYVDARVAKGGDTMTGDLAMTYANPTIKLNKTVGGTNVIYGTRGGVLRWGIQIGDAATETGSANIGSNFALSRYNDAGSLIDSPLVVNRTDGKVLLTGDPTVALGAATKQYTDAAITTVTTLANGKVSKAGDTMTGALTIQNTLMLAQSGGSTAQMYFGNSGTSYLYFDGTNWGFNGSGGVAMSSLGVAGTTPGATPGLGNTLTGVSVTSAPTLYASRGVAGSAVFNINADGPNLYFCRSGVIVGSVNVTTTNTSYATSSDERLKTDLQPFNAGGIIDATNVYDFAWRQTGERSHGVIAQQAISVFPEAVTHDPAFDNWSVDYSRYVPLLLQEIKDLRARVAALEQRAI